MKTETQNIIIIGVIIVAALLVFKDQFQIAEALIIGLIGFIAPKTLTERQSEKLDKQLEVGEDVQ